MCMTTGSTPLLILHIISLVERYNSRLTQIVIQDVRLYVFFFQAEDGIRDLTVTGVQTCALPISSSFRAGATRKASNVYLLCEIPRYIFAGDTALHIAAAAYRTELVRALLRHGADVHAVNRLGYQPIHSAAVGIPGSSSWNPTAQAATIRMLIDAGADPNATDKRGVSPLHQAV